MRKVVAEIVPRNAAAGATGAEDTSGIAGAIPSGHFEEYISAATSGLIREVPPSPPL